MVEMVALRELAWPIDEAECFVAQTVTGAIAVVGVNVAFGMGEGNDAGIIKTK